MSNRSQEENIALMLNALRNADVTGLTLDQAKTILFGNDNHSKTATKKVLDHLKAKGCIRVKVVKTDIFYSIVPGR
jgi:hypothetical protein